MAKMRTIQQAVQYLRQSDPDSAVSEWWLRQLVKSGKLKCHRAGNRYLIDLDFLEEFLKNPPLDGEIKQQYGVVRFFCHRRGRNKVNCGFANNNGFVVFHRKPPPILSSATAEVWSQYLKKPWQTYNRFWGCAIEN